MRFPTLPEEGIANRRSKTQNQNTSKSTKPWLKVFKKRKGQRNEERKLEDIPRHELDVILCRFLLKFEKKTVTNTNEKVWLSFSAHWTAI